jgi:hypothetical protein
MNEDKVMRGPWPSMLLGVTLAGRTCFKFAMGEPGISIFPRALASPMPIATPFGGYIRRVSYAAIEATLAAWEFLRIEKAE